jgi:hypothetical protein
VSDVGDPLNDPQFPGRPQHPDFWRISQVATQADGQSREGGQSTQEIMSAVVDPQSVRYAAEHRALRVQAAMFAGAPDPRLTAVLTSLWLDGFLSGARFEQEGGHRDA